MRPPGCKINLGLRITGKLANGYHTIRSIFYPLPWPRDELNFTEGGRTLVFSPPWANPETNTVYRAWSLFGRATGFQPGLRARLIKRVPVGGGLGGGSANAAATLLWLNERSGQMLDAGALTQLALEVGADVPFFLRGVPCLVEGIGEKLTPMALDTRGLWLVLAHPGLASETRAAYAALDAAVLTGNDLCASGRISDGDCGDSSVCGWLDLRNDLEGAVFAMFPPLAELKGEMVRLGAIKAAMSGSGSSVYGLFASAGLAVCAARILRQKWPRVYCMPLFHSGM